MLDQNSQEVGVAPEASVPENPLIEIDDMAQMNWTNSCPLFIL